MTNKNSMDVNCPKCGKRNIDGHVCTTPPEELVALWQLEAREELQRFLGNPAYNIGDFNYAINTLILSTATKVLHAVENSECMKRKNCVPNMLQDDRIFEDHGMDGVRGHNKTIKKVKAFISKVIAEK